MATGRTPGRGGIQRILSKLETSVADGNYYEAHQLYRTLYFRYNAQKKYAEAIDLLYNGATLFFKHNQHGSATDLALLLVEVLKTSSSEVNDTNIDRVASLHKCIEKESVYRPTFVSTALQWSSACGSEQHKSGHPGLHQKFAITWWEEKNYARARYHFLHSQDGEGCASMLIEYHAMKGYPSEADLFIAQAVLQYLCLQNKSTAETAFTSYTRRHPQVENGPPYIRPLLNFLWLLLLAVEGGKVAVFTILCEQYRTALQRDPTYTEYLDRIGQLFFGVPPPRNQSQGLFGDLIKSLFGAEDDEEDEDEGHMPGPSRQTVTAVELD